MRNNKVLPERELIVIFRSGKKKETLDTWRYWEIVGALQWMGADRITAYDTAKVLQHATPCPPREVWPGVTMEIIERSKPCC